MANAATHGEAPVELVPYDPTWPARFAQECALLERVLGLWLAGPIEHIGSTAMTLLYSLVDTPAPADARVVDAGLGAANDAVAPLAEVRPLACFARTPAGAIVGGAVGRTWGECCELQQLWVDLAHRRQGVGRELVRHFAAGAQARHCRRVYLETFSFQAPAFYRALGFSVALEVRGFPADIAKFTLLRELA